MRIQCPSCTTENEIDFGDNILCHSCKKSLSGHTYKKFKKASKPIGLATALLVGVYGGFKIDNVISSDRYPTEIEYAIIDSCVNASSLPLTQEQYAKKIDICTNALVSTIKSIDYPSFRDDESKFYKIFNTAVQKY